MEREGREGKYGASFGCLTAELGSGLPPLRLAGAQSQDPRGAVGEDWCEEVTNVREGIL